MKRKQGRRSYGCWEMLPWRCLKSIVMVSGRILSGLDDDFAVTGLSSGCRHWTGHGSRSFCLLLTGLWEIGLVAGEHLLPLDGPGKQELLLALEARDAAATGLRGRIRRCHGTG